MAQPTDTRLTDLALTRFPLKEFPRGRKTSDMSASTDDGSSSRTSSPIEGRADSWWTTVTTATTATGPTRSLVLAPTSMWTLDEEVDSGLELHKGDRSLALSVKNTFLHVELETPTLTRCASAPGALSPQSALRTSLALQHERGECRPCAYFSVKVDGCRRGNDCEFCHVCTVKDIKRRKKERAKATKAAWQQRNCMENALEDVTDLALKVTASV
eukprot:CAMPEP_0195064122 /NCGR_PEP_ID=MMETSP0448-20130528/10311_1 /TAXON_ID=66468 /ORGANISM="Heterocapsa triquestra, Strain CCMP 448" /LENGTH=214 /DNA_ID=CAMNT_0040095117 /DNA_START=123 /DNA_END=767 /DNA_ORIENTATION=+